jgi:hypothetical protein
LDVTSIEDYNQAQFIERNNNCITIREWQEMEGTLKQTTGSVHTASVELITEAVQMPITTHAGADYVSPFKLLASSDCEDKLFEITDNNSDEMIGDIVNDLYRKYTSNNTPMKKKQLFEYENPSKPSNELLRFKDAQTFLSPTTQDLQRIVKKAASCVKVMYSTNELKATRKNILQSVDHILSHNLFM